MAVMDVTPKTSTDGKTERPQNQEPEQPWSGEQGDLALARSQNQHFPPRGLPSALFSPPERVHLSASASQSPLPQGACLWLTGLSGAGKTTTARTLALALEKKGRRVTVLDGDEVRNWLSRKLGFSKEDRDVNVKLLGFMAAEIVRHGGIVICAVISPYRTTRQEARRLVGDQNFVEVFVDTPLEVCEARDVKGLYRRARRGEIQNLTGIDSPYEPPELPEIRLNTVTRTAEDNVRLIMGYLKFKRLVL